MLIRFRLSGTATLVVIAQSLLAACTAPREPVEIAFAPGFGDKEISCTEGVDGLRLSDLRFFVHDLRMLDASGRDLDFRMTNDGRFQDGSIALVDLEDGQGACQNGSPDQNRTVSGTVRGGRPTTIAFSLGVPGDRNHLDPVTAPPPGNLTAMHWHWLTGYKFLRAAVSSESDGFSLHLGSSHCDGAPGTFHCQAANRPVVVLEHFDTNEQVVIFDIKKLFQTIDLKDGIAGSCSSGPDEADCRGPFVALGLAMPGPALVPPGTFRAGPKP